MRFLTMWYVRPAQPQISLRIRAVWSESLLFAWIFFECWATDWTSFGVSKLKGGCTGPSESTLVKMPHCWKSRVGAHFIASLNFHMLIFNMSAKHTRTCKVWKGSLKAVGGVDFTKCALKGYCNNIQLELQSEITLGILMLQASFVQKMHCLMVKV